MNKGLSSALDASRWIAALMVVISHVHHLVLANYPDVHDPSPLWKLFYFFGSFGTEAVVIFFVVSGYLVGGLTANKWIRQSKLGIPPQMGDYCAQRFARIYTVLLPALLAGWLFDYLGSKYFDGAQLYTNADQYHTISLGSMMVAHLGLPIFLGNLLMLENILVPVFGTNGPLWSLAYEWWYYCIFAAAMGVFLYRGPSRWTCAGLLLLSLVLPVKLLVWMSIWLLGIAALYYLKSDLPKPHPLLGLAVLLGALAICRFNHGGGDNGHPEPMLSQFIRDFGLGLAYAFALIGFSRLQRPIWMAGVHTYLAAFSYSIYLTHFPAMVLLVAVGESVFGIAFLRQPSFISYLYLLAVLAMIYVYGFVFSLFTERQTAAVRAFISTLLVRLRKQPVSP